MGSDWIPPTNVSVLGVAAAAGLLPQPVMAVKRPRDVAATREPIQRGRRMALFLSIAFLLSDLQTGGLPGVVDITDSHTWLGILSCLPIIANIEEVSKPAIVPDFRGDAQGAVDAVHGLGACQGSDSAVPDLIVGIVY